MLVGDLDSLVGTALDTSPRRDGRISVRRDAGPEVVVEITDDVGSLEELSQAIAGYLGVPFEPSEG